MKSRRRTLTRAERTQGRRSRPPLSKFARRLLQEWRRLKLPVESATLIVGVSGGADSVALLLALDELTLAKKLDLKLIVAHIDHRLRKSSASDARWVKDLAASLGYPASVSRVNVRKAARGAADNLEQAARRARYRSFGALAQKRGAELVLTAHTVDDQAETILLNLLRGSGADGLSGMETVRLLNQTRKIRLTRPLLSWAHRSDSEDYCRARGFDFRRDEMNEDETFARVRVRRRLIPLLETFNPRIVEGLARTGDLLRDDSKALESGAQRLLELSMIGNPKRGNQISTDLLAGAGPALRRRTLRRWLEKCRGDLRRLELAHIRSVDNLVTDRRGGRTIELPGGATVSRQKDLLIFKRRTFKAPKA